MPKRGQTSKTLFRLDQLANCHSAPLRYLDPLPYIYMERFDGIPMDIFRLCLDGSKRTIYITLNILTDLKGPKEII